MKTLIEQVKRQFVLQEGTFVIEQLLSDVAQITILQRDKLNEGE